MKFNTPCELYYVNPSYFNIEKLVIDYAYKEEDETIYYISKEGAYLHEFDLFEDLKIAKGEAIKRLNNFYSKRIEEIMYVNPRLEDLGE